MDPNNGFAGVTLSWLYENIERNSRIAFLNSHSKFLAARKIQSLYRGWRVRKHYAFLNAQATIIQKTWRGYLGYQRFFNILEQTLQNRLVEHYNRSATIIQSLWRGFWVRKTVHDQKKLTNMQIKAAMDLINCVAHKLHHMLRTHQIPGVYSIKNSNCYSKVEELLASLRFKEYNDCVRKTREARLCKVEKAIKESRACRMTSPVPFGSACSKLCAEPDADKRMFELLETWKKAKIAEATRKKGKKLGVPAIESDFCSRVRETMKKYQILDQNLECECQNLKKTPENIERFVDEINSVCGWVP